MAILIVMAVFLVLITAETGVIEGVIQMAGERRGGLMRSCFFLKSCVFDGIMLSQIKYRSSEDSTP